MAAGQSQQLELAADEVLRSRMQQADAVEEVRSRIQHHLRERGVFEDLRLIVSDALGTSGDGDPSSLPDEEHAGRRKEAARPGVPAGSGTEGTGGVLLFCELLGGRAFFDVDGGRTRERGMLRISLQLGDTRLETTPIAFCSEPALEGPFHFPLPLGSSSGGGAAADAGEQLLRSRTPLHLLLLESRSDGSDELVVSSLLVEWRKVLQLGRCTLSIELPGIGPQSKLPIGCLEMRLQLLPPSGQSVPPLMTELDVHKQLKAERTVEVEAERRFFSYARSWWDDYLSLRPAHRGRAVKLFALSELGVQRPVTCFVQPMRADRMLDSPLQAAHFVSLLRFERSLPVGGTDVWNSCHAMLCRRAGEAEEHALLLCSLLLGFGLDAYVCIGTDLHGPHVWVMTRGGDEAYPALSGRSVTFWEPSSGARYLHAGHGSHASTYAGGRGAAADAPYRTLSCVFSHERFYANAQPDESLSVASLQLDEPLLWKPMDASLLRALTPLPAATLTPAQLDGRPAQERAIEAELRRLIERHRSALGLGTAWDSSLEYICAPALFSYEMEPLSGRTVGAPEFQAAVRSAVPVGHMFKGFPTHFTHTRPSAMLSSLIRTEPSLEVMQCRAPQVQLALRLRIFPYPDGVVSAWLMLACRHAALP